MNEDIKELKTKTISSLTAKLLEQFLSLGLQLLVSIVLARLLNPSDYGIIAIVNVFIVLSNVFIESGIGVGLIQKKEISSNDIGTTFISSFILGILLYLIIFFTAPFLSSFFKMSDLTLVMRVYGITIIISSIISSYNSYLSRKLDYKKPLIATIIGTIISGAVGIVMALNHFGVWSLVIQYLVLKIIFLFVIIIISRFIPKLSFSFKSFKGLVGFSWKVFASRFIANLFNQIRNLIIGKQFDSSTLGNYNKGNQYPSTIATAIDYSIQSVMFSVYSKKQDDLATLKAMLRRSMKLSSYVLFPVMIGIAAVAKPLVSVVLTEKWIGAVPFIQIACFMYVLQPVNTANQQAINALGKSGVSLILEVAKRSFAVVLLVVAIICKDVFFIAWSAVAVSLFGWLLYMPTNARLLGYSLKEQLEDILPIMLVSTIMGACVFLLGFVLGNSIRGLFVQVFYGIMLYFLLSAIFKLEPYKYILNLSKDFFKKRKQII